jgi:tight adherence protein B
MDIPIRLIIAFSIISIIFIELVLYAFRAFSGLKSKQMQSRLKNFSFSDYAIDAPDILRKRMFSNLPFLNKIFYKIPGIARLDKLIQQANAGYPAGVFMLLSLLLMQLGFLVGNVLLPVTIFLIPYITALVFAVLPLFYLILKKRSRLKQFEKQLPEALELIARSLRAGHAFTSGMKVAVDNFGDPLGPEFGQALDEINFGVPVADALRSLAFRIDCAEIKFFVVAVILQRETGGNLAEIIDNIAHIIRERFKFRDKIKVLSAEGKISAIILTVLPFIIFFIIRILNPDYVNSLFQDPVGIKIIYSALILVAIGIYIMKRMITIEI